MEKKENIINYRGVKTHNLKNIDIKIDKNKLIAVAGPSGSGKSSLVYGTIYNIAEFEEARLKNDVTGIKKFIVDDYSNIIPAVEIKQTNNNSNPRSTIATFLNLDTEFKKIFTKVNNVSPTIFTFNNPKNACEKCMGLGYVYEINDNQIIDENKSIKEGAFLKWHKTTLGYEEKLLIKFAEDNNISITTKFKDLKESDRELLCYGTSEKKYQVSFKAYGKPRNKAFRYVGILKESEENLENIEKASNKQKVEKYSSEKTCPYCGGQRFNKKVLEYKVLEKSIGEFYIMEIEELYEFLIKNKKSEIEDEVKNICQTLKEIIKANIGYLNLNRSIPSLSGGELQRLRLVSIMNSKISNMMYIIDEPSAKLHVTEYENLYENFKEIKKRENTVIFVEHNPYFLKRVDEVIFIGPGSGEKGGKIMKNQKVEEITYVRKKELIPKSYEEVKGININTIKDLAVKIPKNCVTGIYGVSGSGKSSLVKVLTERIDKSEYITQKPIRGSINSTIGTYSGDLFKNIREELALKYKINEEILNFNTEQGACPYCGGKGTKKFLYDYGKEIDVTCDVCEGKRYSEEVLKIQLVKGKNIYEILTMTIETMLEEEFFESKKVVEKLNLLRRLGLGHLNLFRTTNTLSGGEAQRVKLSSILGKKIKDKFLFFDEPLSGLSLQDSCKILDLFRELAEKGVTIVFIEHNILAIEACDYIIEMGPGKGKNGGKIVFSGSIDEFKKSENYKKYKI